MRVIWQHPRAAWVGAAVALLAMLLAACGAEEAPPIEDVAQEPVDEPAEDVEEEDVEEEDVGEEEPEEEEPEELEPASIRIPFGPSGGLMGPYVFGAADGIYAQHGIELTVEDGAGSLVTAQDVAAGNTDFTMIGGSALAQGIDSGMPLISVGGIYARPQFGVLVPEDSDIQAFQDLEGRSVITSPGSPETILMPAAFRAAGVDAGQVEVISVDAPAKASSYVQRLGDAVGTSYPYFRAIFEAQGVPSRVLLFEDQGVGFPEFHVTVHTRTLQERPELVERFLRATYEALAEAFERPDDVIAALQAARPSIEDPDPHRASLLDHAEFVCSDGMAGQPVGYHVEEEWRQGLEILQEFGDLTGDIDDLSRFFTNQFFEGDDPVSQLSCPWP
jgi:NitT/TauT family transport system substrate-binding protein